MTVRVERTFELPVPPERVWEFISDPEKRARPISVVSDFETGPDGDVWHIELPIPLISRTVAVETRDVEVDPPNYVKFVGTSKAMRVTGEHRVERTDGGSRLTNRFVVEGRLPGVERYFRKHLDGELENLERALKRATA